MKHIKLGNTKFHESVYLPKAIFKDEINDYFSKFKFDYIRDLI